MGIVYQKIFNFKINIEKGKVSSYQGEYWDLFQENWIS